jgi:hypothetical protein
MWSETTNYYGNDTRWSLFAFTDCGACGGVGFQQSQARCLHRLPVEPHWWYFEAPEHQEAQNSENYRTENIFLAISIGRSSLPCDNRRFAFYILFLGLFRGLFLLIIMMVLAIYYFYQEFITKSKGQYNHEVDNLMYFYSFFYSLIQDTYKTTKKEFPRIAGYVKLDVDDQQNPEEENKPKAETPK